MSLSQNFEVQILSCADCEGDFEFSESEQEFYAEKGFSQPKRCPDCRESRRRNKRGGNGGGGSFNKQKYNVVCSECGIETTVPFKPRDDRPVFCSDCYRNQ